MKNQNLFTQNSIFKEYLKKGTLKKTSKNFDKVFKNFENEINNIKKTQNILSKDYRYNINFKNLNKFKNFQKIVLIGMGGSILGSEAIKNFLQEIFIGKGNQTKCKISKSNLSDIKKGVKILANICKFDIGKSIIIKSSFPQLTSSINCVRAP